MIPRLDWPASAPLDRAFASALVEAGFRGETTVAYADRTALSTDNSIYQVLPGAVVFPRDRDDLVTLARLAGTERFRDVKLAPRGGGTGTNGQSLTNGLVVDLSRHMTRILEVNPAERWVRVEAGIVKDEVNAALAPLGLFFAPDLSTSDRATIGGMIGTDASGQGSCRYGKTRDHVLGLTAVLLGGEVLESEPLNPARLAEIRGRTDRAGAVHRVVDDIARDRADEIEARFPKLNRCLTGYDLAHIRRPDGLFDLNAVLCGSEGTLALIAEARIAVVPLPGATALIALRYDSFDAALRDARALTALGPTSIETIDSMVLDMARRDPVWRAVSRFFPDDPTGAAAGINIAEFTAAAPAELETRVAAVEATLAAERGTAGRLGSTTVRGPADVAAVWQMRKKAVGLLGNVQGERRPLPFVEDTAVPPQHLADYIAEFRRILDSRGLSYGMFGHVDAGVLHVRPALDLKCAADEALVRDITEEVFALVGRYGGLLWGEHGKGVRSEFNPAVFGPLYPALQAIKAAFDPFDQLNPGKIAAAPGGALLAIDSVPTRGQRDRTIPQATRAAFGAALHCNGNGVCFTFDRDLAMCPSWKGRRERRHSPKGRAQLLREWLRLLSLAGCDPIAEAERLRNRPAWKGIAAGLRNATTRRRGEEDFSHSVKEAMDGCLGCKACSTGCPIKVDVPAFRSKFLALYHTRYSRPIRDHLTARLEQMLPWLSEAAPVYNLWVSSKLGKGVLGRLGLTAVPRLAGLDFRREMRRRGVRTATPAALARLSPEGKRRSVVVVQDAYTRFFETSVVLDVFDLLRAIGVTPWLAPYRPNGKAMQAGGMLGPFTRVAKRNAAMLRSLGETGVPLVGIDPAITLTYRSEYGDALGREAAPEVLLLQEWLAGRRDLLSELAPQTSYVLLPHCTERTNAPEACAAWKTVFAALGQPLDIAAVGCCGMAGAYGHERAERDISETIYRLSWAPRLARTDSGRLLATGYSCRSQAALIDGVHLRHPASAIKALLLAANHEPEPKSSTPPLIADQESV